MSARNRECATTFIIAADHAYRRLRSVDPLIERSIRCGLHRDGIPKRNLYFPGRSRPPSQSGEYKSPSCSQRIRNQSDADYPRQVLSGGIENMDFTRLVLPFDTALLLGMLLSLEVGRRFGIRK